MSDTRLTCRKCLKEFDYNSPMSCEECKIHISPLICLSCHNRSHKKTQILVYRYRRLAGVQLTGISAWFILLVGWLNVF